ncbi:MAG: phosphoglucosamine mutase [Coriobacteriia bacterium]|nr:phosphoglucosamine mutase [Coriobacteriia bacterium]
MEQAEQAAIHFGTDGWRAVIGDDFTSDSLARLAQATAEVFADVSTQPGATLLVGYDARFRADAFARLAAEVIAAHGVNVILSDRIIPTPTLCWAAARRADVVGAVMLTASHNDSSYLGYKVRLADGGAALPEFTDRIVAALPQHADYARAEVETEDLLSPYLEALRAQIDTRAIAAWPVEVVVDPLYGAGQGALAGLLREAGVTVHEIHDERNPGFGGLHPEPIEPWVAPAREAVLATGSVAALITDGDADRIGALDETGLWIAPPKLMALLATYLVEDKGQTGAIIKTRAGSVLVDRIARALGCDCIETPIGFKWVYEQMIERPVLIGGEESGGIGIPGHLLERDGLLMAILLVNVMAARKKPLKALMEDIYERVGDMKYRRIDVRLSPEQMEGFLARIPTLRPAQVTGLSLCDATDHDGLKLRFDDDQWLLLRPSGTEPLVRIYAEALTQQATDRLLNAGYWLVTTGVEQPQAADIPGIGRLIADPVD